MTILDRYLGSYYDKFEHAIGCAFVVLAGVYVLPLGYCMILAFAAGIVKELIDCWAWELAWDENEHPVYENGKWRWWWFDWKDILANSVGIALASIWHLAWTFKG